MEPRVRLVGCRVAGETDPCSLHAPSQRDEEPVPRAGPFEDNARRHGALTAVSLQKSTLPSLNLLAAENALAKLIMWDQTDGSRYPGAGEEGSARTAQPCQKHHFMLQLQWKILLPPCPGTPSCCTRSKEPPQAPTSPARPKNAREAPPSSQGAGLDPGCMN